MPPWFIPGVHPGSGARHWAHFQHGKVAAKVHVVFDPKAQVPIFYELTSANTNDITVAKSKMPIEAGATYVFGLGYYDFGAWANLDAKGRRFVTRLKKNTPVTSSSPHSATPSPTASKWKSWPAGSNGGAPRSTRFHRRNWSSQFEANNVPDSRGDTRGIAVGRPAVGLDGAPWAMSARTKACRVAMMPAWRA